ncbi:MAG TPA: hypothetical protein PLM33_13410, partial [Acidobacteriota bacterium]|nr:hypothetical protein [Acidobacteriota bacterium]
KRLIFPSGNRKDVEELPAYLREGLEFLFVRDYKELFDWCFAAESGASEATCAPRRKRLVKA